MATKFLTKKRAIELCIELWTWLAETGEWKKSYWPRWPELITLYGGEIWGYCWFCEYDTQMDVRYKNSQKKCKYCPLSKLYGSCGNTAYNDWEEAETTADKKLYAAKFLSQIKLTISTK